jgi:O-methyltransferase involved in polyketide biosynthesis
MPKDSSDMLPEQASQTMVRAAIRRAAHQLLDHPRIFEDPIAVGLIPEASEQSINSAIDDHSAPIPSLLRSIFAFRSRFAEERLLESMSRCVCHCTHSTAGSNLDFSNISVHRGRESEKDVVLQQFL